MDKPLTAVTSMEASEVSLVDKGANRKKRFPIFKSEERMDSEILKAVLETEVDGEKRLAELLAKAELSDKGQAAVQAAVRLLSSFKDELPEGVMGMLQEAAGLPSEAPEANDAEKTEDGKEDEEPEEAAAGDAEKAETEDEAMSEDIKKELEVRDLQLVELKKQNEEFQKSLKVERDARELAVWVDKAKADLSHYPGKSSDELGAMLKTLHDTAPEIAQAQFEQMKVASEALKESTLLKSAGASGGSVSGGSAWDKIEKLADGYIEKAENGTDRATAIAKVLEMNPDLYSAYLQENPKQIGN